MKLNRLMKVGTAFCLPIAVVTLALAQDSDKQAPPAAAKGKGPGQQQPDPRVQQRTYHFADTNEDLPYALYVSSKVSKDKKNPLIVALHGLGGTHNSLMRGNALDLAEEGGYILVGPMGYNPPRMVWRPRGSSANRRSAAEGKSGRGQ